MSALPTPYLTEVPSREPLPTATKTREHLLLVPWRRALLGLVMLLAGALDFYQLSREGWSNEYYASAVRSMLQSWHNFFFVSFDPGGFVSIDKPPLGFWIETASAKLFGFNGISLLVPQALASVLSVAVLFHLVSRAFGFPAGLVAALALAVTPISVVGARSNNIDSQLVLVVLLSAWTVLMATETGRLRWLLLTAVLLGLGFNIKTMQAYLVLPACALVYALAAPGHWLRRGAYLAVAAVVLLAISVSWIVAVDLTPASQRPYVGSSCTNSELNLALGYNGLGRLTGGGTACAASEAAQTGSSSTGTQAAGQSTGGFGGGPGGIGENGAKGPLRLLNEEMGGQIGWLLPLAVIGLLAAAFAGNRRGLFDRAGIRLALDRRQQSLVLWGMWLLVQAVFFSVAGFFHQYYLVMLAPAIAALSGIGVAALWEGYRRGGRLRWPLPLALVGVAAVQAHLLQPYPDWSRWLAPLVVGLSLAAAALLVVTSVRMRGAIAVAVGAAVLGVSALFAAPTTWAAYTAQQGTGGGLGHAGPSAPGGGGGFGGGRGFGGFGAGGGAGAGVNAPGVGGRGSALGNGGLVAPGGSAGAGPFGAPGGAGGLGGFGGPGGTPGGGGRGNPGGQLNQQLLAYLERHQGTAKYLLAVSSSMGADPYIINTGKAVMALGGFAGSDKILSVAALERLVKDGTVRYFLLGGNTGGPGFTPSAALLEQLPAGIRARIDTGRSTSRTRSGGFGGRENVNADLTAWVGKNCALVPASAYGSGATSGTSGGFGDFGGGSQLYDCAARSK